MRIRDWFSDHAPHIAVFAAAAAVCAFLLEAFGVKLELKILLAAITASAAIAISLYDIIRKKRFYNAFFDQLQSLDKKYLVTALDIRQTFLDSRLFIEALTQINKSMLENVNDYRYRLEEVKDYIELWVHEVKIPLSTIELMLHNDVSPLHRRLGEQTSKITAYIEQVLYYIRAENAEKDYLIRNSSIKDISGNAIRNNKESFLIKNTSIQAENLAITVRTDAKWMEFILGQLLQNSLQYGAKTIRLRAYEKAGYTALEIEDDGIGIPKDELSRVFEKSFTGTNGRLPGAHATGMGLYICKCLCKKLGHKIEIESVRDRGTTVRILFGQNDYFRVIEN